VKRGRFSAKDAEDTQRTQWRSSRSEAFAYLGASSASSAVKRCLRATRAKIAHCLTASMRKIHIQRPSNTAMVEPAALIACTTLAATIALSQHIEPP